MYQLIVLGPKNEQFDHKHHGLVESSLMDLGLTPNHILDVLHNDRQADIDWRGIVVGLWYSGESEPDDTDLQVLKQLMRMGVPVFPLVEDLQRYAELVPEELHPINGLQWDDPRVVGDILRAMHLTRPQRQVFISYRRSEAHKVATEMFNALSQRGYGVFLDTASVDVGATFQQVLMGSLADMDILIFLDTSQAPSSKWVMEELTQAGLLGLGVLQLVWPNKDGPTPGPFFSQVHHLKVTDFESSKVEPTQPLTGAAIETVLGLTEKIRIQSLAARRNMLVGLLIDEVDCCGLKADVQPSGPIYIRPKGDPSAMAAVAFPHLGIPDSPSIFDVFRQVSGDGKWTAPELCKQDELTFCRTIRVVYSGLGVEPRKSQHLVWLNDFLPVKTARIERDRTQAASPVQTWLQDLC